MAIRDLKNKRVLVTGAASGIGRATALAFAGAGAHVLATDLRLDELQTLRQEIEAAGGVCRIESLDVSDEAQFSALARRLEAGPWVPDVLINNAGIAFLGKFLDADLAHWRRVLDVNVMGVVHGCRHLIPLMLAAGGPRHVLNVSSSAGNYPAPSMAAYAASKGAVSRFSEVLQMELAGTAVRVTTVCPGVINTPIVRARQMMAASFNGRQAERLEAYYQAKGCAPAVVAADMLRAVQGGADPLILLSGPSAALLYWLNRCSPRLTRRLMLMLAPRIGYL
jgi:NAD(P)-dependent dehydrogenase (short-subunit alcohol dehydrogenase family)